MTQPANVDRDHILSYCNQLLQVNNFKDYCPNGLQIEGKAQIQKIVSGVTASQALLDAAIAAKADAILVHHGYFWRSEALTITGIRKRRIETVLKNNINLIAYHLPLDAHRQLGNNAQLAKVLDIDIEGIVDRGAAKNILFYGQLEQACDVDTLAAHITERLNRAPLTLGRFDQAKQKIKRLAWCTGAAQHYLQEAAELGVDAFISGEVSENTTHIANELGIHYFAAGHHATERYGVQALGEHLAAEFGLEHQFIDLNNPV